MSSSVQLLVKEVTTSLKWKLTTFDALETWTKGSVALLGDSCHPTLPYRKSDKYKAQRSSITISTVAKPQDWKWRRETTH